MPHLITYFHWKHLVFDRIYTTSLVGTCRKLPIRHSPRNRITYIYIRVYNRLPNPQKKEGLLRYYLCTSTAHKKFVDAKTASLLESEFHITFCHFPCIHSRWHLIRHHHHHHQSHPPPPPLQNPYIVPSISTCWYG